MGYYRGVATDEGWVKRRFVEVERRLAELASARRLGSASVSEGELGVRGSAAMTVEGGGSLRVGDSGTVHVDRGGSVVVGPGGSVEINTPNGVRLSGDGTRGQLTAGALTLSGADGDGSYARPTADIDTGAARFEIDGSAVLFGVDRTTGMAVIGSSEDGVIIPFSDTTAAANVRISEAGVLLRVSSSRRGKPDAIAAEIDPADVLALTPTTWTDPEEGRQVGLIAEEVADRPTLADGLVEYEGCWSCGDCADTGTGYEHFRITAGDVADAHAGATGHATTLARRPRGVAYERLAVAVLALVQHQQTEIIALRERLDAVEAH